ncbi:MAG TPA: ABC transporter substrate-binding protein, partial [Candidatus Acidoferrales bacterium]|nr:ABC transporter substrate-binding protein [Candidatus Acidoferrales bacterium]
MNARRTRVAAIVAAALIALGAGGCSKRGAHGEGGRNPWTVPGVLRIGADEEPDSLNLMYGHTAATDSLVGLLFSFLFRYDENGNYVPDLATQIPSIANGGISRDGLTITYRLRPDVRWQDGVPFTSRDVK